MDKSAQFVKKKLFIRTDGNSNIGLGHLYRCLAIADILQDDFRCIFIISSESTPYIKIVSNKYDLYILKSLSMKEETNELSYILSETDFFLIDSYKLNEEYFSVIKNMVDKLIRFDDMLEIDKYTDLFINPGAVKANLIDIKLNTKFVTGFEYAIVREPFIQAAFSKKKILKIDSVFICMGGSDPFNITIKTLAAASNCDFLKKIVIVVGAAYSRHEQLREQISKIRAAKTVLLESDVTPERLVELLDLCELAICPSSSISLEVCCAKAGLLTGTVIDNQHLIHDQLVEKGCCFSIGDMNLATIKGFENKLRSMNSLQKLQRIINNQALVFDGQSKNRLVDKIKELIN